ncbi:MAG: hypothetical protein ACFB8W_04790 [Elainellaceae cyanobacterium]
MLIQTKGSVPQIASTLEICAAALMRQCPVEQLIPVEPSPLFNDEAAQMAASFQRVSLGQYFWPVERERIASAWGRGDFAEAAVWLESHKDRCEGIYKLAKHLSLASNGETKLALARIQGWCGSKIIKSQVSGEQIRTWQGMLQPLLERDLTLDANFQLAWEENLFIELALKRDSYTIAFMQFAQLLERLLYIRAMADKWVQQKLIIPQDTYRGSIENYRPTGLGSLLIGWYNLRNYNKSHMWFKLLDAIRELRNDVIHNGKSVNDEILYSLWKKSGFDISCTIFELMMQVLNHVIERRWHPPSQVLLRSLHQWGLETIRQID